MEVLRILYDAQKKMQKKDFGLSDFFACWLVMNIKLTINSHIEKGANKTNLAKRLLDALNRRKKMLLDNVSMSCAIYLDRRFASELSEEQVDLAKESLTKLWERIRLFKQNKSAPNNIEQNQNKPPSDDSILEDYFESKGINAAGIFEMQGTDLSYKFEIFENSAVSEGAKRLNVKTNILEWWETKKDIFPEMYVLHCIVNGIPSTQVVIERDFSTL